MKVATLMALIMKVATLLIYFLAQSRENFMIRLASCQDALWEGSKTFFEEIRGMSATVHQGLFLFMNELDECTQGSFLTVSRKRRRRHFSPLRKLLSQKLHMKFRTRKINFSHKKPQFKNN